MAVGKSVYVFKFDDATGEVQRYEITILKETKRDLGYRTSTTYMIDGRNFCTTKNYLFTDDDLDRYKSGKVITFDADVQKVKAIIAEDIKLRRIKAQHDFEKYTRIYELLKKED